MTSPYLTAREAAAYVRKTEGAFNTWCWREGIQPDARTGRKKGRLFKVSTLEKVMAAMARRDR